MSFLRTIRNIWRAGPKAYGHNMQYIGDAKAGTLIGQDRFGNKFYENLEEELPLRTRWVDYRDKQFDASQIEPGWHAWMSYMTHEAPPNDPISQPGQRVWEKDFHMPNMTASRSAYRPYNTTKQKTVPWVPKTQPRQ